MAYYNNSGFNNSNQTVVFNQPMYNQHPGSVPPPPGLSKSNYARIISHKMKVIIFISNLDSNWMQRPNPISGNF